MATVEAIVATVWLSICIPVFLTATLLLLRFRGNYSVRGRGPLFLLIMQSTLLMALFVYIVFLMFGIECGNRLGLSIILNLLMLCVFIRGWVLLVRFRISRKLHEQARHAHKVTTTGLLQGADSWFVRHRHLTETPFLVPVYVTLAALITLAPLVAFLQSGCDTSETFAVMFYEATVGVWAIAMMVISVMLCRAGEDAFGIKREMLISGAVAGSTTAAVWIMHDFAPDLFLERYSIYLAGIVAIFFCSTIWPMCMGRRIELDTVPMRDANLNELDTLESLLDNRAGYESFLAYATKEFAQENLLFWQQAKLFITEFNTHDFMAVTDRGHCLLVAEQLINDFILENSPSQVNLPAGIRNTLIQKWEKEKTGIREMSPSPVMKGVRRLPAAPPPMFQPGKDNRLPSETTPVSIFITIPKSAEPHSLNPNTAVSPLSPQSRPHTEPTFRPARVVSPTGVTAEYQNPRTDSISAGPTTSRQSQSNTAGLGSSPNHEVSTTDALGAFLLTRRMLSPPPEDVSKGLTPEQMQLHREKLANLINLQTLSTAMHSRRLGLSPSPPQVTSAMPRVPTAGKGGDVELQPVNVSSLAERPGANEIRYSHDGIMRSTERLAAAALAATAALSPPHIVANVIPLTVGGAAPYAATVAVHPRRLASEVHAGWPVTEQLSSRTLSAESRHAQNRRGQLRQQSRETSLSDNSAPSTCGSSLSATTTSSIHSSPLLGSSRSSPLVSSGHHSPELTAQVTVHEPQKIPGVAGNSLPFGSRSDHGISVNPVTEPTAHRRIVHRGSSPGTVVVPLVSATSESTTVQAVDFAKDLELPRVFPHKRHDGLRRQTVTVLCTEPPSFPAIKTLPRNEPIRATALLGATSRSVSPFLQLGPLSASSLHSLSGSNSPGSPEMLSPHRPVATPDARISTAGPIAGPYSRSFEALGIVNKRARSSSDRLRRTAGSPQPVAIATPQSTISENSSVSEPQLDSGPTQADLVATYSTGHPVGLTSALSSSAATSVNYSSAAMVSRAERLLALSTGLGSTVSSPASSVLSSASSTSSTELSPPTLDSFRSGSSSGEMSSSPASLSPFRLSPRHFDKPSLLSPLPAKQLQVPEAVHEGDEGRQTEDTPNRQAGQPPTRDSASFVIVADDARPFTTHSVVSLFGPALNEVYGLMVHDLLPRYLLSPDFQLFVDREKERALVASESASQRQHRASRSRFSTPSKVSRKRSPPSTVVKGSPDISIRPAALCINTDLQGQSSVRGLLTPESASTPTNNLKRNESLLHRSVVAALARSSSTPASPASSALSSTALSTATIISTASSSSAVSGSTVVTAGSTSAPHTPSSIRV